MIESTAVCEAMLEFYVRIAANDVAASERLAAGDQALPVDTRRSGPGS